MIALDDTSTAEACRQLVDMSAQSAQELEGFVREAYFSGCSDHNVATAVAQLGMNLGLRIAKLQSDPTKISLHLSGKIKEPLEIEIPSVLIDILGDSNGCTARIDATVDAGTLQVPERADAIRDLVECSILSTPRSRGSMPSPQLRTNLVQTAANSHTQTTPASELASRSHTNQGSINATVRES